LSTTEKALASAGASCERDRGRMRATGAGVCARRLWGCRWPRNEHPPHPTVQPLKNRSVFFRASPKIATPCNALILIAGGKEPTRRRRKARRLDMTLIATDVMASVMVSVMARSMVDENDDDSRRIKPTLNHISKTHGRAPLLCRYRIAPALSRVARLRQHLAFQVLRAVPALAYGEFWRIRPGADIGLNSEHDRY
jgi:hypothetical protein